MTCFVKSLPSLVEAFNWAVMNSKSYLAGKK